MALSPEVKKIIEEETAIFERVIASLRQQKQHELKRYAKENQRARQLTQGLVAASRDEDKAMLASDEAVSHALRDKSSLQLGDLDSIISNPYFARMVLLETNEKGQEVELEYKIGFKANPDCRIIDWRKAPISKLYYEYREGEEYCEEIQGRERRGRILKRHSLGIKHGILRQISCSSGSFTRDQNGAWNASQSKISRTLSARGELPEILSLITAEQFSAITGESERALLIQGVAGSGKTTVALYRLAYLLHEANAKLEAANCQILVKSPVLKQYLSKALPSINIEGVSIMTYSEWTAALIKEIAPEYLSQEGKVKLAPITGSIKRLKSSPAFLKTFEEFANQKNLDFIQTILGALERKGDIIERDATALIDQELVKSALEATKVNLDQGFLDECDCALVIRLFQIKNNGLLLKGMIRKYDHIVVDETQDFSALHLWPILFAVETPSSLTLVGDRSQSIDQETIFPGWTALVEHIESSESKTPPDFLTLSISHRSTLPIIKLASHVRKDGSHLEGRKGRIPLWIKCSSEQRGIAASIKWLQSAMERHPDEVTVVICCDEAQARAALGFLKPTFGSVVRAGDQSSFTFEQGIIVTSVADIKGLEFFNVLIWNPSKNNYPAAAASQSALYVAITRAEENLCLITWGTPSAYLPDFYSGLVRPVEV